MPRIGAVGCGRIGLRHQEAYLSHPQAKLVCVCDMDKAKADARAKQLGVKAYYSIKEMLANEPLDAVDVVTADHLHFAPVMECLEAGKHTMTEKPLSLDIREAEQMVAKAQEKGVHLAINYNRRYAPAYVKAREWFNAGAHGKLAYIMMKLAQGGVPSHRKGEYYLLYELETHAIDLLRYFGGEIVSVSAHMARPRQAQAKPGEPACYTSIAISLKFASEAVATLLASWDADFVHPIEMMEICGDKGTIMVDNIMSGARLLKRNDPVVQHWTPGIFRPELLAFDGTFQHRVHAFVNDLVANRAPAPTGLDGLKALRVVEAIVQSWKEQKAVELPT
jgi:predicted dehydrogenase